MSDMIAQLQPYFSLYWSLLNVKKREAMSYLLYMLRDTQNCFPVVKCGERNALPLTIGH